MSETVPSWDSQLDPDIEPNRNTNSILKFRSELQSRPVSALVRSSYSNSVQNASEDDDNETNSHDEMASSREKWKVMDYRSVIFTIPTIKLKLYLVVNQHMISFDGKRSPAICCLKITDKNSYKLLIKLFEQS